MLSHTGHLNPTYKIATALKARGHRVCYLSVPDWIDMGHSFADHIRAQGFEVTALAQQAQHDYRTGNRRSFNGYFPAMESDIDRFVGEVHPDLLVVDALLPLLALKAYELGVRAAMLSVVLPRRQAAIRPPLLTTIVPKDHWASRLRIAFAWRRHRCTQLISAALGWPKGRKDLYQLTRNMAKRVDYPAQIHYDTVFSPELGLPELIACVPDFDFPTPAGADYYYIGSSVDLTRDEQTTSSAFPWERLAPGKPLVFCTLGSESARLKYSRRFFQTVIDAFAERPEWQLVIAVSNRMETDEFRNVAANVLLVNWAPQLQVLKKASLMINHGGLGTIKECILSGVPMMVFPSTSDQPGNAARVVYHRLGMAGDMGKVNERQIQLMVETLLEDSSFRTRLESMSLKFRAVDDSEQGVKIIEGLIASQPG